MANLLALRFVVRPPRFREALKEARKTVQNIKSIWVETQTAVVENGEISRYRVNVKVTFLVRGHK